ncbi:MAG: hypothetical protein D6775_08325, partial [Caldilineae bacterium]
ATPASLLPAPLYIFGPDAQIVRLEADGRHSSQITRAEEPITDFDVSQQTGNVVYVAGDKIYLTDAFGKEVRLLFDGARSQPTLLDKPQVRAVRFSPRGGRIAFAYDGVQVLDIATGAVEQVQPNDGLRGYSYQPLSWAPRGDRLLLYQSFFTTRGRLLVKGLNFDVVVFLGDACCDPTWSPDGRYVYTSGPYFSPEREPGLKRYDTFADGAQEVLIPFDPNADELDLVHHATLLEDGYLYSFRRHLSRQAYSDADQKPAFEMVRSAADGVSDVRRLRNDRYALRDVLWAQDGSGAAIVPEVEGEAAALPVLWLAANDTAAVELGAQAANDYIAMLRWGADDEALARERLRMRFVQDTGIRLAGEDTWEGIVDIGVFPLQHVDEPLWVAYTIGMRRYEPDTGNPHVVGIYRRRGDDWQQVALYPVGEGEKDPGADFVGEGGVRQVEVEPENIWLEVNAGVGAHSGTYHLLRFDGSRFHTEAVGFSSGGRGGFLDDINGDGTPEVVLDVSDYYVFCYACSVRYRDFIILRWNGQAMEQVRLQPLGPEAGEKLRRRNQLAIALAEARLWRDALELLPLLDGPPTSAVEETVAWNQALIRYLGEAKRPAAAGESVYPILENLFFGDYRQAVAPFRQLEPADIFSVPSALVAETVAAGWEDNIYFWVNTITDHSLMLLEERDPEAAAAAYFLRAWAAYLVDPEDPMIMANLESAASLMPDDPLYAAARDFLAAP